MLIVDDTIDIAELLGEALRDEGFETALAHDGQSAIDRWQDFSPHAAILDVGLPIVMLFSSWPRRSGSSTATCPS